MRLASIPALAAVLIASSAAAQQDIAPPPPVYVPGAPDLNRLLANLTDQPATHTGFTFDKTALTIAQGVLASNGMDSQRAAVAITGISFDRYHYQQHVFYTPEAMTALIESLKVAGWKHMVNANQTPANTAQPRTTATDLWLHFSGVDIDALTVLMRGPQEMNVVHLTGDLRPLDLLHLSGHFGIPKVDPNAVMVPAR